MQAVEEKVRLEVLRSACRRATASSAAAARRHLPILVALVERHGRPGAGNCRVNEDLHVQPSTQLHHKTLPVRQSRVESACESSATTNACASATARTTGTCAIRRRSHPPIRFGRPGAGDVPHPNDREGNPGDVIRGLPGDRAPDVAALAGRSPTQTI